MLLLRLLPANLQAWQPSWPCVIIVVSWQLTTTITAVPPLSGWFPLDIWPCHLSCCK